MVNGSTPARERQPRIGVLALQGDFAEHINQLDRLGVSAVEVRKTQQLEELDGLIIPGGESTTIIKLMNLYGFDVALPAAVDRGMALWGTCAGMIAIARELADPYPEPLGLIDIKVARNWFGRQVDSFEEVAKFEGLKGGPFRFVYIRAPMVESEGHGVERLASHDGQAVAVRQGRILATAFHPELTEDTRVHEYFVGMATSRHSDDGDDSS